MYRANGKTITKDYWVTMRIASEDKAETWRAKSGHYFRNVDPAGEAESIGKIAGACALFPEEKDRPERITPSRKALQSVEGHDPWGDPTILFGDTRPGGPR